MTVSGGSRTRAAEGPRAGSARATTCAQSRSSRLRRPIRTTSAPAPTHAPEPRAAPADPDPLGAGLQHVAGADRAEEADLGVAGEQPLVAVHPDRDLGGDIAEQAERVRAVDQVAAVVRVAVRDVPAVDDGQPEVRVLAHAAASEGTSACTR